jgi:outer membrane protein TolC
MLHEDSRLVKIEQDNADMSFEDTIRALSPLLPHISANASKTYYKDQVAIVIAGGSVPTGEREPMAWGADIYQTLFDFGKSVSNYKASTEAFGAGKAKVDSVRRTVVLEFIIAYFDVLESEKMISVAQTETETLESYLAHMER